MSEAMRMWVEVTFNICYLLVVWGLVIAMIRRRDSVSADNWPLARLFIGAFGLLALGDTGHVGFRVLAYALGGLDSTLTVFDTEVGLVGLGALATATTVTFFYVMVLLMWQQRFKRALGWFGYVLLAAAVIRLALMIPAANAWNSTVPPQPWSLYRNLPLVIQGLGVAFLILRDATAAGDRPFIWIGIMILASYTFYTPVILFVQQVPMLGMLMIPKTLAYVAIAIIGYRALYPQGKQPQPAAA
jgi:hypothetical protein